jgi:polyhydroxyalkanoate synthesis regulator phasin
MLAELDQAVGQKDDKVLKDPSDEEQFRIKELEKRVTQLEKELHRATFLR